MMCSRRCAWTFSNGNVKATAVFFMAMSLSALCVNRMATAVALSPAATGTKNSKSWYLTWPTASPLIRAVPAKPAAAKSLTQPVAPFIKPTYRVRASFSEPSAMPAHVDPLLLASPSARMW